MSELIVAVDPAQSSATLTLNRPEKRNALSTALRDEMSDALYELAGDDRVKVVIITGAGTVFSAGFDLKEFDGLADEAFAKRLWASSDRWHHTIINFPLPTIAAINGPALAGGFDLAVMCDIRLASNMARFGHPEQAFSDVVFGPLHDVIGGLARDLCFTGRFFDADEAKAMGLVSVVVEGDVVAEAQRWAEMVARAPRDILMRTKAKATRRAGELGATLDL